ncbi:MAG TPA: hypothetical protein VHQ01_00145 [Pyrinomonadaceae bacterium]|jgi:hypothetical protein|nr:hypothetical protein [Pyrinomonadaceae bacterium]
MKKSIVFAAFLSLFVLATAASAQKAPADFSGTWNLDVAKSSLGQQAAMIKSQTLTIKQDGGKFTTSVKTERNPPPADAPAGGGGGGRPGGGGGGFGGGGEQTFSLDGKEMSMDMPAGPNGATSPMKMTGKWDGSKVVTMTSTTRTGQDGTPSTTTRKSTYELGAGGKSLTVTTDTESPRGKTSTTSVYTKG